MRAYIEHMGAPYGVALCYGSPVRIPDNRLFDRCVIIMCSGALCLCGMADKFPVEHKVTNVGILIKSGEDYGTQRSN